MSDIQSLISNLLGRIFLKKPVFFGMDSYDITVVVGPSMKVYAIHATPKKLKDKFPFTEKNIIDLEELKNWASNNGYNISFQTDLPQIARRLSSTLGDVMVEGDHSRQKSLKCIVMEELEQSNLPENMKEWARRNPEKFIKNIELIQEMLKK
jgi:hypothetical protein